MDAGDADIVNRIDFVAHDFGGDPRLFRHRNVAGSRADHRDFAFAPRLAVAPEADRARGREILGAIEFGVNPPGHFRGGAGDQDIAFPFEQFAGDADHVIGGFSQTEDHFRRAVAQGAVVVDFGKTDVLKGHMAQPRNRRFNIRCAAPNLFEETRAACLHSYIRRIEVPASMFLKRLRLTLDMIKFEHSVFALPFALTGALLAFRDGGFRAAGAAWTLLWIVVAMVGARSAAMAFNRLVDASIDSKNPRTKTRHIPSGLLSKGFGWGFTIASSAVFLFAAWELNPLCFRLAPLALAIVFAYSFTKRFTHFSHLVLGFALGIAPAAAWIAVRGSLDPRILLLTAAVMFWTAGLRHHLFLPGLRIRSTILQLYSVPRLVGIGKALIVARALHVLMIVCAADAGVASAAGSAERGWCRRGRRAFWFTSTGS